MPVDIIGPLGTPIKISNNLIRVFIYSSDLCKDRDSALSHSSVLLCLTVAPDDLCLRFRQYVEKVDLRTLAAEGKFDLLELGRISSKSSTAWFFDSEKPWGRNLAPVMQRAVRFASSVSTDKIVGVRHLMAAYIFEDDLNRKAALEKWGFNLPDWAQWFLQQMEALRPGEVDSWTRILEDWLKKFVELQSKAEPQRKRKFTTDQAFSSPSATQPQQHLMRPHFLSDRSEAVDRLGYGEYAYALFRFLTDSATEPLAVSIQAPWGGGKTTFMKLVRLYMDRFGAGTDLNKDKSDNFPKVSSRMILGELKQQLCNFEAHALDLGPGKITIWFNPWKYENTEQVWSGLADAIISGVSKRMGVIDRERFWLRLNLARVDVDKVRSQIQIAISEKVLKTYRDWLVWIAGASITTLACAIYSKNLFVGAFGTAIPFFAREIVSRLETSKADKEPAEISLKELVSIPDYSQSSGFVHRVSNDLEKVMEIIGDKPIVIFIDDLDRCSSDATAAVFEGLNRFISGEFRNCTVVMGMDDEVVAAALTAAYPNLSLSEVKTSHSPGWKFMDKFIQVPLQLPEPTKTALNTYKKSLLSIPSKKDLPAIFSRAFSVENANNDMESYLKQFAQDNKLNSDESDALMREYQNRRNVDSRFDTFETKSGAVCEFLSSRLPGFLSNPRDLKRCVNAVKFSYLLSDMPDGDQDLQHLIQRVVLDIRWPAVARYLRRNVSPLDDGEGVDKRCTYLFLSASRSENIDVWSGHIATKWGVSQDVEWLKDKQLFSFLRGTLAASATV